MQPCVRVADLAATILVGTASSSALQCSCSCAAGLPATQGRNISKCHPPWRNGRSIEAAGAACQQHGLGWVPLSSFSGSTLAVHFLTHAMDPPHATISPSSTNCHTKHKYPCQALQHTAPTNDAQVPAGLRHQLAAEPLARVVIHHHLLVLGQLLCLKCCVQCVLYTWVMCVCWGEGRRVIPNVPLAKQPSANRPPARHG